MRKILSAMRRAIEDYNMIEKGDKIAVGVSGGKDSLSLLAALNAFREFSPIHFDILGVTVDMGFEGSDFSVVEAFCKANNIEYVIKKTDIKEIIFDIRKEERPCSLCAKMRRGAVNDLATLHGCNKVALGHHNEDVIETFFLSLFYEGRLSCFNPVSYLSRKDIYVIRPFIYVHEGDIKGYAKRAELPVVFNPCPMDGYSKRQDMKDFINEKNIIDKNFKTKMMHAIQTGLPDWKIDNKKGYGINE